MLDDSDGVNALYAREAYELNVGEDKESLNVLAPTSVVHGRYDTLNLPTFNIDVTAPAEGVIRVVAGHWQESDRLSGIPLHADDAGDRDYVRTAAETGDGDGEVGEMARAFRSRRWIDGKVVKGSPWNLTFSAGTARAHPVVGQVLGTFRTERPVQRDRPAGW